MRPRSRLCARATSERKTAATPHRASAEVDFERWLVGRLDVLAQFGFPLELSHQQRRMANRLCPDLLCRFTDDIDGARAGDLLVIELKTVPASPEAVEQLAGYLPLVESELAADEQTVFGLLIADGCPAPVDALLDDADLEYLPLSALRYRAHLN